MPKPTRKQLLQTEQRFKAALKKAGWTQEYWRTEYYVVSRQHLNDVFNARKPLMGSLKSAIRRFTKSQGL